MNGLNPQSFFLALDLPLQSKLSIPCAAKEPLCLLLKKAVTFSFLVTSPLLNPFSQAVLSHILLLFHRFKENKSLLLAEFFGLEETIKIYVALLFDFKIRVLKCCCPSFYPIFSCRILLPFCYNFKYIYYI